MSTIPINRPKFFNVFLQPQPNNLIIPTEFTIKHGCELTDHVLLNVPNGKSWKVQLVKSHDEILFEKGWEKFRDYYSVEFGSFLVFVYDGDSRFTVFMFSRTCSEISFSGNWPKFFKVILEPEANSLMIPMEFSIKHGRELSDRVFLNVPSGKSWEIEVVKSDDVILLEKGWGNFRDYYSVEFGYFLVFVYDGDSRFTVFVFNRTCNEIDYPFDDTIEDIRLESDDYAAILDESLNAETKKSSIKGQEGSDGSLETRKVDKESVDTMELEGEGTESNMGKDNFADQEGGSSYTKKSFTLCKELKLSAANRLSIEKKFVDDTGIRSYSRMILQNTEGKEWDVTLVGKRNRRTGLAFRGGWNKFLIDNKIIVGSTMLFEFISRSKLRARVVKTGPNEKELFRYVVKKRGRYMIAASHGSVRSTRTNVSRSIKLGNNDEQIKEKENSFLVGSKSGVSNKMETMREKCTEVEDLFHDNGEEVGSESDASDDIVDDNNEETGSESDDSAAILVEDWKVETKKTSIKGQEGSDGASKTRDVDEESVDTMELDGAGEDTESNKGKDNFANQEGGSSHIKKSFTFRKELTLSAVDRLSNIEKKFVDDTGIRSPRMTLRNTEGKEWDVKVVGKKNRRNGLAFGRGWKKFLIDNKIIVGSTMLFEFISSSKLRARVVKTGPNEKDLFRYVLKKGGKYMIAASHDSVRSKRTNVSRSIKLGNDDEQIKEKENSFLVGSKSGVSNKMETMREKCTEVEDRFHDNGEEVGSESDASDDIVDENCKTKKGKGKRLAVVPPQDANDESIRKKLKTKESAEKMEVDGEVTETDKYTVTDDGLTLIIKQLMVSNAYKLEIPRKFEECNGLKAHEQITLQNMEGVEWPVLTVGKTSTNTLLALCRGWKKFLEDNNVTVGSRFSLKFISTSKFQAQVVKPGPNKDKLLGNVRRKGGKHVIVPPGDLEKVPCTTKSENRDNYQTTEGEENDDYLTEKGEKGSSSGSKLNVSRIMKTRGQVELELLRKYGKKIQNSDNGSIKTGREKAANSYGSKRPKL